MKALVLHAYGPPEHLSFEDVAEPVPAAGEVLVRVLATSVNPYDWHYMRGEPRIARLMPGGPRRPRAVILGCDLAGRVEAVGEGVTAFRPGDDVYALLPHGAYAEYVTVPEDLLAPKPANLSHAQAAAMPMAAVTALVALSGVERGHRVLVNGASGGVGTFAVQLAKALGARVDAVCNAANADLARSLGATEVTDYREDDFTRGGRTYDVLLDIAGSRSLPACRRLLTRTGRFVAVGGPAGRWVQPWPRVRCAGRRALHRTEGRARGRGGLPRQEGGPEQAGRVRRVRRPHAGDRSELPVRRPPRGDCVPGSGARQGKGRHNPVIAVCSSGLRARSCAARFSRTCAIDVVPGIGRTAGERPSSQASAICETVAPCRAAMGSSTRRTASGPAVSVGAPGTDNDTGCHGTKTA